MTGPDPEPTSPLAALPAARRASDRIWTAGQPDPEAFQAVAGAGIACVVNLALPTSPRALPDERGLVEAAGMEYLHLPVVFENPTRADYLRFEEALSRRADSRILVHCALNFRASAFLTLYRIRKLGWSRAEALRDLESFWNPEPAWRELIEDLLRPE